MIKCLAISSVLVFSSFSSLFNNKAPLQEIEFQTIKPETHSVSYGDYFISNGSVALGGSGNYARYWYFIIPMTIMNTINDTDNFILMDDVPSALRHHLFGGFLGSSMATNVLSLSKDNNNPIFTRAISMSNSMYYGNRNTFTSLEYIAVDSTNRDYDLYQITHNDNAVYDYYHLLVELQGSWSGTIDLSYLSTEESILKGLFGGGVNPPSLYNGSLSSYWYNYGYDIGYGDGYNIGFVDGINEDFNAYSWLTGIFTAVGGLLSIQLLPNVSIGGILILIMVLTLLPFLIGLLKGGKG